MLSSILVAVCLWFLSNVRILYRANIKYLDPFEHDYQKYIECAKMGNWDLDLHQMIKILIFVILLLINTNNIFRDEFLIVNYGWFIHFTNAQQPDWSELEIRWQSYQSLLYYLEKMYFIDPITSIELENLLSDEASFVQNNPNDCR